MSVDLDDALRAARPQLEPSPRARLVHRAALDRVMGTSRPPAGAGTGPLPVTVEVSQDEHRGQGGRRVRPPGGPGWWAGAAAASVVLAAIGAAMVGDGPGTIAGGPSRDLSSLDAPLLRETSPTATSSAPVSTSPTSTSPPSAPTTGPAPDGACGATIPIELSSEVFGALTPGYLNPENAPEPGPGIGDPVVLAANATGQGWSLELRWPAGDRVLRADEPVERSPLGIGENPGEQGSLIELLFPGTMTREDPIGVPLGELRTETYTGPEPACRGAELRVIEPDGSEAHLLIGLAPGVGRGGDWFLIADYAPIVVATADVTAPPTEVQACNGGVGDVPPNKDEPIVDAPAADTPFEAFLAYAAPDGDLRYVFGGHHELVAADGSVSYVLPVDPDLEAVGAEYFQIVLVEPVTGGWAATHYRGSGC